MWMKIISDIPYKITNLYTKYPVGIAVLLLLLLLHLHLHLLLLLLLLLLLRESERGEREHPPLVIVREGNTAYRKSIKFYFMT